MLLHGDNSRLLTSVLVETRCFQESPSPMLLLVIPEGMWHIVQAH